MTHHSKSKRLRLSNIFSQSAPSVLEPLPELDEEAEPVTSNHKMLAPPRKPSRLQRLSMLISPLKTTMDTKVAEEHAAVLRKPLSPPSQTSTNAEAAISNAPPTRAPPPAPSSAPLLDVNPLSVNPLSQFDLGLPQSTPDPAPQTTHLLQKEQPRQRALSTAVPDRSPRSSLEVRKQRGNSLNPPATNTDGNGRSVSTPMPSRPASSYNSAQETSPAPLDNASKTKSWLGGGGKLVKSRHNSKDLDADLPAAWINAGPHKIIYSTTTLLSGDKIPEMWDEQNPTADTYVYLFPRESGRGPQFKVQSDILSCSQALLKVAFGDIYSSHTRAKSFDGRNSLTSEDAARNMAVQSPETTSYNANTNGSTSDYSHGSSESINSLADAGGPIHLYFPVGLASVGPQFSQQDIQKLIDVRNLFAFLTGQPLVSTRACPSTFRTFLSVADMLKLWQFTNMDGSTFGESAQASFAFCCAEQELADVRNSREKTVEALILGERMRYRDLYNEAFAHAAGKYNAVSTMKTLWTEVSPNTRSRLERASLDLITRQRAVDIYLTDFDFPSVFAGIGASTSSAESKAVKFKTWKASFLSLRRHILAYYKDLHGQWPPKAGSKKNNFVEGGLNRLVLKGLYNDLCRLYDYLVDRDPNSFTTRTIDASDQDSNSSSVSPASAALRKLLGEFDQSSPPVKPPIPFDIPLIPAVEAVTPDWSRLSPKEKHKNMTRKLKDHETPLILAKSHNMDAERKPGPFLMSFKLFEEKEASGRNAAEVAEMRYGHWIFLYCCIQTLPYLVMDAPGLKFTEGVEYFLCEPPMGNAPWIEDADGIKMSWYGVTGGQGVVSLPSDIVNYGVEATYRRSHCWVVANRWLGNDDGAGQEDIPEDSLDDESMLSPLSPPPGFGGGELGLRPSVRRRHRSGSSTGTTNAHSRSKSRQSQRNSIALGLERLPIPTMGEGEYMNSPVLGGGSRAASPFGARPQSPFSAAGARRPASRGFDAAMREGGGVGAAPTGGVEKKASTFDDILGSMNNEEKGGKKKGKK